MIITIFILIVGCLTWLVYSYLSPPYDIANIPSVPMLPLLLDNLKYIPFDITYKNLIEPIIRKHGYARVWRLGRWVVYFQDTELIKQIHRNTTIFNKIEKVNEYGLRRLVFGSSNIVFSNGNEWKKFRKCANPAFNKGPNTYTFGICAKELINLIENSSTCVDIHSLFEKITIDILGRAIFNYDFKAVKGGNDKALKLYDEMIRGLRIPVYSLFPCLDLIFRTARRLKGYKSAKKFREFLKNVIYRKLENHKPEKPESSFHSDLLTSMINSDEKQSEDELINNTMMFFLAGHDTTANTLSFIIMHLCKKTDIQKKAREEVLNIMSDNNDSVAGIPTTDQINKMHYLTMIIKESMRCTTTVPEVERRMAKDFEFKNGLELKKGNIVVIHSYGAHHDYKYKNPYEFDPERYRDNDEIEKDWMPFGNGTRKCIGMNFSMDEQKVILSMLLMNFNIVFSKQKNYSPKNIKVNPNGLLKPIGLYVDFIRRK